MSLVYVLVALLCLAWFGLAHIGLTQYVPLHRRIRSAPFISLPFVILIPSRAVFAEGITAHDDHPSEP